MKRSHFAVLAIASVIGMAACRPSEKQQETAPVEETAPPPAAAPPPPMPDTTMMQDTMRMRTDTMATTR